MANAAEIPNTLALSPKRRRDVTHMFSKIMMSNCNGGKDNEINSTQAGILRDVGRTIVHMVSQDGATIEGACGLIDVMIRTLRVRRVSNVSSTNKIPVSTVDESTNLNHR